MSVGNGFLNQNLTVAILRNRILMKVILCFWYLFYQPSLAYTSSIYIGIPVVLVVLYEFVLTLGHGFLNQSLTVTIVRNRIDMKVFNAFLQLFLQL